MGFAFALSFAPGRPQTLQRLTVESFDLSTDAPRPVLETPFHLIVRIAVREQAAAIDNVDLPILAELELLGDERRVQATRAGTVYRETITVVAHHTGDVVIGPVTLAAVDARDGKPKRYFSNGLTLHVGGGSLEPLAGGARTVTAILAFAARTLLLLGGAACAVAIVVLLFRRRPAPVPPAPAVPPPPPRSRRERLTDALLVLRAERNRSAALRVRAAVWNTLGAPEGETLVDVLRRAASTDSRMNEVLRSLERAAFTYDADVAAAVDDACARLERYLETA